MIHLHHWFRNPKLFDGVTIGIAVCGQRVERRFLTLDEKKTGCQACRKQAKAAPLDEQAPASTEPIIAKFVPSNGLWELIDGKMIVARKSGAKLYLDKKVDCRRYVQENFSGRGIRFKK